MYQKRTQYSTMVQHAFTLTDDKELILFLVPIVREILQKGLTENFLKSCVRIGEVLPKTAGLKSNFVGHIRIDVNTIVKIHTEELNLHKSLMEKVNSQIPNKKIFPNILQVTKINDSKYIMLMEELLKHESFLTYIYVKATKQTELEILTKKVLENLSIIHETPILVSDNFKSNRNPYYKRIKEKIYEILSNDKELSIMDKHNGRINNNYIISIESMLSNLNSWLKDNIQDIKLSLNHGDYHLENILFRPRGRGYSCLTIDPNPLVGESDPLYDFGKLLHWIDIVGWAKYKPVNCKAIFNISESSWEIEYYLEKEPKSVKKRRHIVWDIVLSHLKMNSNKFSNKWDRLLNVSLASSHLGFASILKGEENKEVRRFVFSRAIELINEAIK